MTNERQRVADALARSARDIHVSSGRGPHDREAGVPPDGWPEPQLWIQLYQEDGQRYYRIVGLSGYFNTYPIPTHHPIPQYCVFSWRPWSTKPQVDLRTQVQTLTEAAQHLEECHRRYGRPPEVEHFAVAHLVIVNPDCFNAKKP